MNYELKQINGIPYYLHGTTLYTFELEGGKPRPNGTAIGTYDGSTVTYLPTWRESVQPRLTAFRNSIISQPRDTFRDHLAKPQKQRKTTRAPRKPTVSRTKNPASVE